MNRARSWLRFITVHDVRFAVCVTLSAAAILLHVQQPQPPAAHSVAHSVAHPGSTATHETSSAQPVLAGPILGVDPAKGTTLVPASTLRDFLPLVAQGLRTPWEQAAPYHLGDQVMGGDKRPWLGDFYAPAPPAGYRWVPDMPTSTPVTVTDLGWQDGSYSISVSAPLPVIDTTTGTRGYLPFHRSFRINLGVLADHPGKEQILDWRLLSSTVANPADVILDGQTTPVGDVQTV